MWPEQPVLAVAIAGAIAAALAASLHAILYKRDVRAAIGWAGFIWVAPYFGAIFYLLFGINRIRRRATALRPSGIKSPHDGRAQQVILFREEERHLVHHAELGDRVCGNTLVAGNRVEILDGGVRAFAVMLDTIFNARRSIAMSTYIFENDGVGQRFIEALAQAASRGVEVRVLLDAVGSRSGGSVIASALAERGIRAARFLSPRTPIDLLSVNLRNHRKLLIVDGANAFTGGMNISDDYSGRPGTPAVIRDVHFAVDGPVVAELQRTFANDWLFTTGEVIDEAALPLADRGDLIARVVADGPDEDFERSRWLILGAIASARRSIQICTPYFLPDVSMITALSVAALRGVHVEIIIPEVLDHRVVKWASNALLWQVLEKGCRVWFTPPPFDHSKLFTIDGVWTLFGSSNWDARSFRLNFELNVEAFGKTLAHAIDTLIAERRARGRQITLEMIDARPLPVRIRDGLARLFVPYL